MLERPLATGRFKPVGFLGCEAPEADVFSMGMGLAPFRFVSGSRAERGPNPGTRRGSDGS